MKGTELESNTINLIGLGTDITGDINSNGDLRIDGSLAGNIKTKGKVIIGTTGSVKGEIFCKNSDIEGKITGKINVQELLSLKATSVINGDIIAKRLAIEPGASFSGNCKMSNESTLENFKQPGSEKIQEKPK
ncbi:MAG: polymer-forming cytoskeletal protein [Bacteroidales bacterium]|nr:polymer-forming cytoskeletal protein [Bacteroidales bacterium]